MVSYSGVCFAVGVVIMEVIIKEIDTAIKAYNADKKAWFEYELVKKVFESERKFI